MSTTKGFTQNFKERYHHKRKRSQGSNPKNYLPEEALKEKLYKDKSLYQSLIFLKELLRLQKLHFPLKDCMDGYFWLSFLQAFFPVSFFLRLRRKHTGRKPRRNSVSEKSSKKFRRNTSPQERWKNYEKRRLSQIYI